MSCDLELFSTQVCTAQLKVITRVSLNYLYSGSKKDEVSDRFMLLHSQNFVIYADHVVFLGQ